MIDIDEKLERKLVEIKDNHARLDVYSMRQRQPGESLDFPSVKDGLLNDRYSATGELLQLELQLLHNEKDPNIFPLDSARKTIMAEIKEKQRHIEEIDREIEIRAKH